MMAIAAKPSRRKVQYASLDELLADAERIAAGPHTTLGNWSAGQIFEHLARAFNGSIDGMDMKLAWYWPILGRLLRPFLMRGPMPAGMKLTKHVHELLVPGPTTTEAGLASLRRAIERQKTEVHREPSPIFGPMSREDWDKLHRMHADLHMSFIL
jgi:hypothetical protein